MSKEFLFPSTKLLVDVRCEDLNKKIESATGIGEGTTEIPLPSP